MTKQNEQICDGKGDPEIVFVLMASAVTCMHHQYLINAKHLIQSDTFKSNIWSYYKQ